MRRSEYFDIAIDSRVSREQARKDIETIAQEALVDAVIEEYRVECPEH